MCPISILKYANILSKYYFNVSHCFKEVRNHLFQFFRKMQMKFPAFFSFQETIKFYNIKYQVFAQCFSITCYHINELI